MIRRATEADAAEVSRVFVAARDGMPYLPRIDDEHRPVLGGWFIDRGADLRRTRTTAASSASAG